MGLVNCAGVDYKKMYGIVMYDYSVAMAEIETNRRKRMYVIQLDI